MQNDKNGTALYTGTTTLTFGIISPHHLVQPFSPLPVGIVSASTRQRKLLYSLRITQQRRNSRRAFLVIHRHYHAVHTVFQLAGRCGIARNDNRLFKDLCLMHRYAVSLIAGRLNIEITSLHIRVWITPFPQDTDVIAHSSLFNFAADQGFVPSIADQKPVDIQSLLPQSAANVRNIIKIFGSAKPTD